MSTNLYMFPKIDPEAECLSKELKFAISQKFWGHDGSLGGENVYIDGENLSYFEGLRDGGIKDAEKVIQAIKKYGAIILNLQG